MSNVIMNGCRSLLTAAKASLPHTSLDSILVSVNASLAKLDAHSAACTKKAGEAFERAQAAVAEADAAGAEGIRAQRIAARIRTLID